MLTNNLLSIQKHTLKAALNYTFCRGSQGILMPEVDTTEITLTETSTGVVAFAEVAEKYNTLAALMEGNVPVLAQNNRQYMLVDVADKGSNGGIITFSCMMLHGAKPDSTAGNARVTTWTAFGPDDNWYYGELKGRIKANGTAQYVNIADATTVLTNAMNTGQGVVNPAVPYDPNNAFYFTDVTNVLIDKWAILQNYQVPEQQLDNILDYYVFYKHKDNSPNGQVLDLVLRYTPHNEMNFYYNGIKNYVKPVLDAQFAAANKEMKCCNVSYNRYTPNNEYINIWHELSFDYGVKHKGEIPD